MGRPRRSGWEKKFLCSYGRLGTISGACRESGISRSLYKKRMVEDASFRERVEEVRLELVEGLEREAWRRAVEGYEEVIERGGEVVSRVRKYSDGLLMMLLRAHLPEVYDGSRWRDVSIRDGRSESGLMRVREVTIERVEGVERSYLDMGEYASSGAGSLIMEVEEVEDEGE